MKHKQLSKNLNITSNKKKKHSANFGCVRKRNVYMIDCTFKIYRYNLFFARVLMYLAEEWALQTYCYSWGGIQIKMASH